jgi:hypothetical protein
MSTQPTSPALFTLRLSTGAIVGPVSVHGAGGQLAGRDAARLLRIAIRFASQGRALRLLEPAPGHVRAYRGNGSALDVDIRGAEVVVASA